MEIKNITSITRKQGEEIRNKSVYLIQEGCTLIEIYDSEASAIKAMKQRKAALRNKLYR